MRRPGGYAIWTDPDLAQIEMDTFTCVHCNAVVFVTPGMSAGAMGGFCSLCAAPICEKCVGRTCVPFEKRLEESERKDEQRRALEKLGI